MLFATGRLGTEQRSSLNLIHQLLQEATLIPQSTAWREAAAMCNGTVHLLTFAEEDKAPAPQPHAAHERIVSASLSFGGELAAVTSSGKLLIRECGASDATPASRGGGVAWTSVSCTLSMLQVSSGEETSLVIDDSGVVWQMDNACANLSRPFPDGLTGIRISQVRGKHKSRFALSGPCVNAAGLLWRLSLHRCCLNW